LVKIGAEGEGRTLDVMEINRPDDLSDIADLGLTLDETKRLLAGLQQEIVAAQVTDHAARWPTCSRCGGGCRVKDYQARAETDIKMLINRKLDAVGRTEDTALTAFTDGCPGLRRILADAGVTTAPMLDRFHIGMRLQHLKQVASGLSRDDSARVAAKAVIVAEVERLHWRLWNGKATNARISIDRIRAVMHHFKGEASTRKSIAPSRKLWTALHALDGYLTGQSDWLINYAERHRAGLRVGTAITEGTANFLVNRRMNKCQQMRWSRRGADLLLQVRCAVYNGTLGSGFGQQFQPANDPYPPMAVAA
jgi:hypothetical protein